MPGKGRRSVDGDQELNLIPVMNLVTILIPFLLMASAQVQLAVIDSTMPAIGAPSDEPPPLDEDPPLTLSVIISEQGFTVKHNKEMEGMSEEQIAAAAAAAAESEEEGPTLPCMDEGRKLDKCANPDQYDYLGLTNLLMQVQTDHAEPTDQNIILVPESRIPYAVIVRTMDASRDEALLGEAARMDETTGRYHELFPFVVIAGGL
jgi:biopolymer transport protein ExbD